MQINDAALQKFVNESNAALYSLYLIWRSDGVISKSSVYATHLARAIVHSACARWNTSS